MRTFPILRKDGSTLAFEIEHVFISRKEIARILRSVDGVERVRVGVRFGSRDDVRIRFAWRGKECVVWEPFGDNSRYWIGLEDLSEVDISDVEASFKGYTPLFLTPLVGLTARWLRLSKRRDRHDEG